MTRGGRDRHQALDTWKLNFHMEKSGSTFLHTAPATFFLCNAGHRGKGHREPWGLLRKEGAYGTVGGFSAQQGSGKDLLLH